MVGLGLLHLVEPYRRRPFAIGSEHPVTELLEQSDEVDIFCLRPLGKVLALSRPRSGARKIEIGNAEQPVERPGSGEVAIGGEFAFELMAFSA